MVEAKSTLGQRVILSTVSTEQRRFTGSKHFQVDFKPAYSFFITKEAHEGYLVDWICLEDMPREPGAIRCIVRLRFRDLSEFLVWPSVA